MAGVRSCLLRLNKVRMAMEGLLIVGDINTPSQYTVEYIPTQAPDV